MKVFVTGAKEFIRSAIVCEHSAAEHRVLDLARYNVKRLKGPQSLTGTMCRILQQQTNISPHVTLLEGQKSGSVVKEIKMFFTVFASLQTQ